MSDKLKLKTLNVAQKLNKAQSDLIDEETFSTINSLAKDSVGVLAEENQRQLDISNQINQLTINKIKNARNPYQMSELEKLGTAMKFLQSNDILDVVGTFDRLNKQRQQAQQYEDNRKLQMLQADLRASQLREAQIKLDEATAQAELDLSNKLGGLFIQQQMNRATDSFADFVGDKPVDRTLGTSILNQFRKLGGNVADVLGDNFAGNVIHDLFSSQGDLFKDIKESNSKPLSFHERGMQNSLRKRNIFEALGDAALNVGESAADSFVGGASELAIPVAGRVVGSLLGGPATGHLLGSMAQARIKAQEMAREAKEEATGQELGKFSGIGQDETSQYALDAGLYTGLSQFDLLLAKRLGKTIKNAVIPTTKNLGSRLVSGSGKIARDSLGEGITEGLQETLDVNTKAGLSVLDVLTGDRTLEEYKENTFKNLPQILEAAELGLITSGGISGTTHGASGAVQTVLSPVTTRVRKNNPTEMDTKLASLYKEDISDNSSDNVAGEVNISNDTVNEAMGTVSSIFSKDKKDISETDLEQAGQALGIIGKTGNFTRLAPEIQESLNGVVKKTKDFVQSTEEITDENLVNFHQSMNPLEQLVFEAQLHNIDFINEMFNSKTKLNSPDNDLEIDTSPLEQFKSNMDKLVKSLEKSSLTLSKEDLEGIQHLINIMYRFQQSKQKGLGETAQKLLIEGYKDAKGRFRPALAYYISKLLDPKTKKAEANALQKDLDRLVDVYESKNTLIDYVKELVESYNVEEYGEVITVSLPKIGSNATPSITKGLSAKSNPAFHTIHVYNPNGAKGKAQAEFLEELTKAIEEESASISFIQKLFNKRKDLKTEENIDTINENEKSSEEKTTKQAKQVNSVKEYKGLKPLKPSALPSEEDMIESAKGNSPLTPKPKVEKSASTVTSFTRKQVEQDKDNVYLFGDNTHDRTVTKYIPSTTQAVIRGLPNAVGIDTKKDRGTNTSSYLTDADFDWFVKHLEEQLDKAKAYVKKTGGRIIIPEAGIGTGKAMLKDKAPKIFKYLTEKLNELTNLKEDINTGLDFTFKEKSPLLHISDVMEDMEIKDDAPLVNTMSDILINKDSRSKFAQATTEGIEIVKKAFKDKIISKARNLHYKIDFETFKDTLLNKVLLRNSQTKELSVYISSNRNGVEIVNQAPMLPIYLDDNAVASAMVRSIEWFINSPIGIEKSFSDIRQSIIDTYGHVQGFDPNKITFTGLKAFQNSVIASTVYEDLGRSILNDLGIQLDPTQLSEEAISVRTQEVGLYAIQTLEQLGMIQKIHVKRSDLGFEEHTKETINVLQLVGVEGEVNKQGVKNTYDLLNKLAEDLEIEMEDLRGYSTKPLGKYTKGTMKLKGNKKVSIPNSIKEAFTAIQNTPFKLVKKDTLKRLFMNKAFIEALKTSLGYVEIKPEFTDKTSPEFKLTHELDNIIGKNQEINHSINTLLDFITSEDSDNNIYFKAKMSSDFRYFLQTNGINPQVDKLHRFLILPEAAEGEYTIENGEVTNDIFYQAIAQAFGYSTDKKSTEEAINFGKELAKSEDLFDGNGNVKISMLNSLLVNGGSIEINGKEYDIEIDHPSHALVSIMSISDLNKAIKEGKTTFKTTNVSEIDAVNNGLVLKELQYTQDAQAFKAAAKGGAVFGNSKADLINNQYVNGVEDLYKSFAREMGKYFTPERLNNFSYEYLNKAFNISGKKLDRRKVDEWLELNPNIKEAMTDIRQLLADILIPKDGETTVSSKARTIVKYVVQQLGYGAGIATSVTTLTRDGFNKLPRQAFDYSNGIEGNTEAELEENKFAFKLFKALTNDNIQPDLFKSKAFYNPNVSIWDTEVKYTNPYDSSKTKSKTVKEMINALLVSAIGNEIEATTDKMFPNMRNINSIVNAVVNNHLIVLQALLDNKIKEAKENDIEVTFDVKQKLFEEVVKEAGLPSFMVDTNDEIGMVLFDTIRQTVLNPEESSTVAYITPHPKYKTGTYTKAKLNPYVNNLTDMGAAPNVNTIHMIDGNHMGRILNYAYAKKYGLIPVHDAIVVSSTNAAELNSKMNEIAYKDAFERDLLKSIEDLNNKTSEIVKTYPELIKHPALQSVKSSIGYILFNNPDHKTLTSLLKEITFKRNIFKETAKRMPVTYMNIQNGYAGGEYRQDNNSAITLDLLEGIEERLYNIDGEVDTARLQEYTDKVIKSVDEELADTLTNLITSYKDKSKETAEELSKAAVEENQESKSNTITFFSPDTSNESKTEFVETYVTNFDGNVETIHNLQNNMREIDAEQGVQISEEHSKHLTETVDSLFAVSKEGLNGLNIYIEHTDGDKAGGYFNTEDNVMVLKTGKNISRARMSHETTYAHEIIHAFTGFGIEALGYASRPVQLLRNVYKQAVDVLTVEDFMPEVSTGNVEEDRKIAEQYYNSLFKGDTVGLQEFSAIGLTDERIVNKLKKTPYKSPKADREAPKTILQALSRYVEDIVRKGIDLLLRGGTRNKTLYDALLNANKKIAKANNRAVKRYSKYRTALGKFTESTIDLANEYVSEKLKSILQDKFSLEGMHKFYQANQGKTDKWTITKVIVYTYAATLFNKKQSEKLRDWLDEIKAAQYGGIIQDLLDDLSTPDTLKRAVQKIQATSARLDGHKLAQEASVAKALRELFKEPVSKEEAQALGVGILDTDFVSLLTNYSLENISDMLKDSTKLQDNIDSLEDRIDKELLNLGLSSEDTQRVSNFINNQTNGLALYLTTHKPVVDGQLLNANNINVFAIRAFLNGYPDLTNLNRYVDQVTTLKSFKHLSGNIKQTMLDKIDNDPEAIKHLSMFIRNFNKDSKENLFKNSEQNIIKGYRGEILDSTVGFMIGRLDQADKYISEGYKQISDPLPRVEDGVNVDRAFFIRENHTPEAGWVRTATRLTDSSSKGHTLEDLFLDDYVNGIGDEKAYLHALDNESKKALKSQLKMFKERNMEMSYDKDEVHMLPILNKENVATNFRYVMSKADKINILNMDTDIFDALGKMEALKDDKKATLELNDEIAKVIYNDFINSKDKDAKRYVVLSDTSEDKRIREIYRIIPEAMMITLKNYFEDKPIMVRKDMLSRYFGFREGSISDIKRYDESRNRLLKSTGRIGDFIIKKIVKNAKAEIVIKTPAVWIGNFVSNIFQCIMQGCSPLDVLSDQREGLQELVEYRQNIIEREKLLAQIKAGIKINPRKLENIERELKESPVAPLISEGLFTAIVEDIDLTDNKDIVDKTIDKGLNILPETARDIVNGIFITKDTALYNGLSKIVQSSDFIARYSLYKKLRRDDIPHPKAIEIVRDSFIDYDLPASVFRKALEDRGMVQFTKFFTRLQRVLKDEVVAKRPVTAAMVLLGRNVSGLTDLENPFDQTVFSKNYDMLFTNPAEMLREAVTPAIGDAYFKSFIPNFK